ncbi:MAG: hypothetical protein V3T72_23350 [Thermoanaerobaculia bacterium]
MAKVRPLRERLFSGSASVAIFLAAAAAVAGGSGARPRELLDPGRVPWTRLELEARKFFTKARTEIVLTSPAGLGRQLIASPRGAALQPQGPLALLELRAAFAGRRSETSVWFDPRQAAVLQRLKLRPGKKGYQKTYRFTEDGVYSHRRSPLDSRQGAGPVEGWGKVEEAFYPYPERHRECGPISEPELLLYMISAAGTEKPFHTCSFSDKTLHHVELKPRGTVSLDVDYATGSDGRQSRRRGRVEVEHVVLQARPVDAGSGDDFEFLGLEGDVDIFLDGRIPVEVAGRLPGLGRIRIKLVAVDLW